MQVYFYIHAWHHLQNIEPVIRELERRNIVWKILTFVPRDDNYPRVEQLFPADNIVVFTESRPFRIGEWLNRLGRPGKLPSLLWSFLWLLVYFARHRPSRLVVSEDVTLWSNLVTRIARIQGIITIHLPAENIHFVEGWLYERARQGRILLRQSRLQKIANRLYPANMLLYQGQQVYWYGPLRILASHPLGLLPETPWVRGSNNIDRVAVNSRAQFEENVRYGLDAARQTITGFPMHDQLIDCLRQRSDIRQRILRQLGRPSDRRICLVIGTAPHYLWIEAELPQAYKAHGELWQALHEALRNGWQILVKVHPREDGEAFFEQTGAQDVQSISFLKTEFSVYELMAASDVVLMFKSSTVISAFALDVPVLAYGIHNLPGMRDFYDRYPSIDQVYSLDEIREILNKLDDPDYLEDVRSRRAVDRHKYGMFDGNNTRRLVELLLE